MIFWCNLLDQNGYVLSEMYGCIVNTFILIILIPGDKHISVFYSNRVQKKVV